MAASTFNVSPYTLTDASFRAWGSAISAGVAAAGWVQTADTGQINWATVTAPGATQNAVAGHEIWRMNDGLQATHPVFLRLQYGSGPNGSAHYGKSPGLKVSLGTASDGAGSLVTAMGVVPTTATAVNSVYSDTSDQIISDPGASPSFVNGDGSSLMMLLWPSGSSSLFGKFGGVFLLVERSRNTDGSINSDGVSVQYARCHATGSAAIGGFTFKAGAVYPLSVGLAMTLNGDTCLDGGNLYPMPLFTGASPRLGAPSKFALGVAVSDLAARTETSVTMYAETNTWTASGAGPSAYPNQGWGSLDASGTVRALLVRTT